MSDSYLFDKCLFVKCLFDKSLFDKCLFVICETGKCFRLDVRLPNIYFPKICIPCLLVKCLSTKCFWLKVNKTNVCWPMLVGQMSGDQKRSFSENDKRSSLFRRSKTFYIKSTSSSAASKTLTMLADSMRAAGSMTSPDGVVSMIRMSRGSAVVTVLAAN
jgi:hypothetical protein